jgi:murein DD-endopeptidase MepM/ murein hydrolase activator NlpD
MNSRNRNRVTLHKTENGGAGRETQKKPLPAAFAARLRGGVRFLRGRLLRLRRRTGLVCARIAVAARRREGGLKAVRRRAAAFLSPRLSGAESAARLIAIAVAVTVGPPVTAFASFVSARLSKRLGSLDRRVYIGAGGVAFAALAAVCVLNLQAVSTPNAETDVQTLAAEAESDGETAPETESEESAVAEAEEEATPAAWELRADGRPVVVLASRTEAENVLERVKASYLNSGSELLDAAIKEDVQIAEATQAPAAAELMDADTAVSYILTGTKEPKVHIVQSGDTVWEISRANSISQDELVKSNPGLVPNRLKIGQQLNLYETKPYLTIRTVEVASRVEPIDFQTNYQNSDTLYKGQTQVLVAGVPGARTTQTQITKENGIVVESVELAAAVTAEPQPQTALLGTKPLETFTGSGRLISPLTHIEISSGFGSRGKRRHLGVDMRSPKGSLIYAADGGVVTTSSYQGSYGNLVVLNHGNGLETYYAHCDALLVSVGDIVAQGQQIGTVGISGNATGYHLHFEVRVNGAYQNPVNYF